MRILPRRSEWIFLLRSLIDFDAVDESGRVRPGATGSTGKIGSRARNAARFGIITNEDMTDRDYICRQTESPRAAGDVTRWLRDETTGLVTNKVYADGKGPRYDYTPDGKLATRIWARGIVTTYSYDDKGKTTRQRWIRRFVELEEKSRNFDFAFEDDNGRMVGASQFYDPDHSKFGESEDSSDSMIITRTQKEWSAEISTSVINGIDLEMQYDTEVRCVACSQLSNFKKQTN